MKPRQVLDIGAAPRRGRRILDGIKGRCVDTPGRSHSAPQALYSSVDSHPVSPALFGTGEINSAAGQKFFDLPLPSQQRLAELFDLTAAEARLAQLLASGDSVEEVAHKLCVKMTTARTQLAAVFSKTDTRRQAKLVAILSRVAHLENAAPGPGSLAVSDHAQGKARHAPVIQLT